MDVATSLQSLHQARYQTWYIAREQDIAFTSTLVGAALQRFENAHHIAVSADIELSYSERGNDRGVKRAWATSDEAFAQLKTFIIQLLEGRYKEIQKE